MKLRFWGVRGSIPCPGPNTVKYGGNTACLELRFDDRLIIVDAGSGIRELGNSLLKTDLPKGPIDTQIFITHTHWDHIMGFPFFTPIYIPGSKLKIYGPVTYENETLDSIIGGQLQYRYFPIKHTELSANITYEALKECELDMGDGIIVKTKYLNHPILCLGYRFEYQGKSICTAYDTEPFINVFTGDEDSPDYDPIAYEEGERAVQEENEKLLRFFQGADILIHDAQYTDKEYQGSKKGWGHSTYMHTINAANKAGVKKLILFHHDPVRSDSELAELEDKFRSMIKEKTEMEIYMAREGMEFIL